MRGRNTVPMKRTFAAIFRARKAEKVPGLPDRNPVMRIACDERGIGPAFNAEHDEAAALALHGLRDCGRENFPRRK